MTSDRAAELEARLALSERRVDAMKRIGQALGRTRALDALLDEVVRASTDVFDADRSTLYLVEPGTDQLWSKVLEGGAHREIRLPMGAGIAGWVAERGESLLIPDAYADPRFNRAFDKRSGFRTRDILAGPVRRPRDGAVIGVLQVLNRRTGTFGEEDHRLLEAITAEIGVALEVSSLLTESVERTRALERARGELSLLFETERAISEEHELMAMLGAILETAMTTLGARSGAIHVLDAHGRRLETLVTRGQGRRALAEATVRVGEGVVGAVVKTNAPIRREGVEGMKRGTIHVRSVAAVPIRSRQEGVLGALELLNPMDPETSFTEADLRTLTLVAAQAGRAISAERRRREREREQRLSAIGQMLSGVLHDLRTPMTLILGHSQLMASADDGAARRRHAEQIERQVGLLTAMTKDLLAFARGDRSLFLRTVQTQVFFSEVAQFLDAEMHDTGIEAEVAIAYRGPARFDETKLRRVVQNIARNAREAMPGGGHFWLRVERDEETLRLTFEDDGPGIPAEIHDRLFEPFATAGKLGGTGLGLAMVEQTAREHGGDVVAERRTPKGTRIVFRIPLEPRLTGGSAPASDAGASP